MEKIAECRITAYPKSMLDPMPKVMIKLEGEDAEECLFDFYPDEISFSPNEFIGLTKEEGRSLKFKKDRAFLQS